MGDRSNLQLIYGDGTSIYFYSHWLGVENAVRLYVALARNERWDDESYLARIIFCELVRSYEDEATGFGIAPYMPDNGNPVVVVNMAEQTVTFENEDFETWTFAEYIALDPEEIPRLIRPELYE